jgi:hypothetical protein
MPKLLRTRRAKMAEVKTCKVCNKTFYNKEMYNDELCMSCFLSVPIEWTCALCGRSFLDKTNNIPPDKLCECCRKDITTSSIEHILKRNKVSREAGGTKDDKDKPRVDLIPPEAIWAMSDVFTFGAKKYGDRNWEKGIAANRLFGAVQRHLWQWWMGFDLDEESGLSHLSHAICSFAMLIATVSRRPDLDNRPNKEKEDV